MTFPQYRQWTHDTDGSRRLRRQRVPRPTQRPVLAKRERIQHVQSDACKCGIAPRRNKKGHPFPYNNKLAKRPPTLLLPVRPRPSGKRGTIGRTQSHALKKGRKKQCRLKRHYRQSAKPSRQAMSGSSIFASMNKYEHQFVFTYQVASLHESSETKHYY